MKFLATPLLLYCFTFHHSKTKLKLEHSYLVVQSGAVEVEVEAEAESRYFPLRMAMNPGTAAALWEDLHLLHLATTTTKHKHSCATIDQHPTFANYEHIDKCVNFIRKQVSVKYY